MDSGAENRRILGSLAEAMLRHAYTYARALYQRAAETLIDNWPFAQRGVRRETRTVMAILEPVAYRIFAQRGSQGLDESVLEPLLAGAIEETLECSTREEDGQS